MTQGILIHAACEYSKIDLTLTKGRSSSSRSKVDISWLRPLASCLSSCWLSQLPEVLARFEPEMLFLSLSLSLSPAASCPSSLRCCSQAQNCSFPSFPPAQCLPSIIHIPTLLSHCENPSLKIMLTYSYIHPTFSLFLPLLLNFIILIPASSASEAP